MKKQEIILITILGVAIIIFLGLLNNLRNSYDKLDSENNNIISEDEIEQNDIMEMNVSGYHLVTYNQSANKNSFIKSIEVNASNNDKIRFVIGSINDKSIVEERYSFELVCKKGKNIFDVTKERYIIKELEYLFMDIYGQDTLYTQEGSNVESLLQNESNKIDGEMIMQKSDFILPFKYTLEKIKEYKALVIGNDITFIDGKNSYYNITKTRLENTFDMLDINRINAKEWEENPGLKTRKEWLNENLKEDYVSEQDLVIIQLGDNYRNVNGLEDDMKDLVEYIKQYSPNAEILWVGVWDVDKQILNKLPGACEKLGVNFINISDLSRVDYQAFVGEDYDEDFEEEEEMQQNFVDENSMTSFTQKFNPNKEAMQIISNRIIEALKFDF